MASVGLTEAAARESGREVVTGVFQMRALGRAHAAGETSGLVKVVAEKGAERVLGVSMACERATDLIAEAALAIRLEATLEELATTIHAHPTFAEALMEAAEAARGEGIHSL
jgi:dihydrolipoamide dehydrogenase